MKIQFSIILSTFFFNQWAFAQNAAPQLASSGDPVKSLLMQAPIILAMFGILYFGVIRPQSQQRKRQAEFLNSLKKGEEVVTAGGILGRIVGLNERVVTIEIAEGTEIKVLKSQVQAYLNEALPAATPVKA